MNIRRIAGPKSAPFTITGVNQILPDLKARIMHGNGPILFLIEMRISTAGLAVSTVDFQLLRDGANSRSWRHVITANTDETKSFHVLQDRTPGVHLWQIAAQVVAGANPILLQNDTTFTVIELPEWDETPFSTLE